MRLRVVNGSQTDEIKVKKGQNLRKALLENGHSPYTAFTSRLNCGGRGLCATCGVYLLSSAPDPKHWHDKLAEKFHYPRLSCQITVEKEMTIEIPEKVIWGKRKK